MPRDVPSVVVAALRGGSGKTTITLGLIQALRDRGLSVAPFKKGPDYIDPFWHTEAAGHPCHNLDPYMMGRSQVEKAFNHRTVGFQSAVIEGNRGLFDGKDEHGSYSTAELAKWLGVPVVLAVDCSMTSRTVAAVVLGCQRFDPELNLAGVILNPVANSRQEGVVRRAIEQTCGLPVLGAVPRLKLDLPERHMGLVPPQEHAAVSEALHQAGRLVAAHVDVDQLLQIMSQARAPAAQGPPLGLFPPGGRPLPAEVTIGVVRDAAFGFYYADNLEALTNHGARLVFCSALSDEGLPAVDALYIGGGFPETHAASLAANRSFCRAVRRAAEEGLPIYAECGGLMYLGHSLVVQGQAYDMAGVFPIRFEMQKRPQGHGYSVCLVRQPNWFMETGLEFRAHEFHYSKPVPLPGAELQLAYEVQRGKGILDQGGGLIYKNVLGTYHHVHALGLPQWAGAMVEAARRSH